MASSDRVGVYRIDEGLTWGTTPATGNLIETRRSGGTFSTNDSYSQSPEVRSDRMIPDQIQTDRAPQGSFEIAMSLGGSFDDLFEAALANAKSTPDSTTAALTVVAATRTVTVVGAFVNAVVGQWFRIEDSDNNDGPYQIETRTSDDEVIVVDGTGLVDVTGEPLVRIEVSEMIRNGVVERSYTIFENYSDLTAPVLWMLYRGMRVGTLDLDVSAQAILSGTFNFVGGVPTDAPLPAVQKFTTDPTTGLTIVPATTTDVLNTITDIELLSEGGVQLLACINQLQLTVDNQLRALACIGHLGPAEINYGTLAVTGNLNAYLGPNALQLIDKHLNSDASSVSFGMLDGAGNFMVVTMPRLRYTGGVPEAGGQNADVPLNMPFAAFRDPVTNCMVQLDIFSAP